MKYINEASFLSLTQHGLNAILRELYPLVNVSHILAVLIRALHYVLDELLYMGVFGQCTMKGN